MNKPTERDAFLVLANWIRTELYLAQIRGAALYRGLPTHVLADAKSEADAALNHVADLIVEDTP